MLHTGMRLTGIQRGVERVDDMRCAAQLPKHVMYNNVIIIILLFSSQTKISAHTKFIYAQTHTGICTRIRTHTSASTRTIIQCVIVICTKSCKYARAHTRMLHIICLRTRKRCTVRYVRAAAAAAGWAYENARLRILCELMTLCCRL